MDNPFKIYNVEDNWDNPSTTDSNALRARSASCKKIVEYGDYDFAFAMHIKDSNVKPHGRMFVATNSSLYNKIYFDLTNSYFAVADEKLYCEWFLGIN